MFMQIKSASSRINSLAFVSGCCAGHFLDFLPIIHGELIGLLVVDLQIISGYNGGQVAAGSLVSRLHQILNQPKKGKIGAKEDSTQETMIAFDMQNSIAKRVIKARCQGIEYPAFQVCRMRDLFDSV